MQRPVTTPLAPTRYHQNGTVCQIGIAQHVSVRLTPCVGGEVEVEGHRMAGQRVGWAATIRRTLCRELAKHDVGDEWIDQSRSPLLSHCSTVRARIEAGLPGARVEGERYLLTTAAIAEEMSNGAI
jgi:hypothetical protein